MPPMSILFQYTNNQIQSKLRRVFLLHCQSEKSLKSHLQPTQTPVLTLFSNKREKHQETSCLPKEAEKRRDFPSQEGLDDIESSGRNRQTLQRIRNYPRAYYKSTAKPCGEIFFRHITYSTCESNCSIEEQMVTPTRA